MEGWLRKLWQRCLLKADEATSRAKQAMDSPQSESDAALSLRLDSLEPRVLFSATPMDAAAMADNAEGEDAAAMVATIDMDEIRESTELRSESATSLVEASPREIVIVDASVDNIEQLLDDLNAADEDRAVFVLDSDRDGVDQITEILDDYTDVESLHIVSHATEGAVRLGNVALGEHNLVGYAGQVASWQGALASNADLLFYGCELAGNESGEQFVEYLSALTGADVAASTDDTGHASLGGDWELEFTSGQIESELVFSSDVQLEWNHLLAGSWFNALTGAAQASESNGDDLFIGSNGDDTANALNGNDFLRGLGGDDILTGGLGNDVLLGEAGDDVLNGANGDDILVGGLGDDTLHGNNQNDVLIGGGGDDILNGDNGNDVFLFTGALDGDIYTVDGGTGGDTIDLSEFGTGTVTDNGSTITVDLGGSESFTINYVNVETIRRAEDVTNHAPVADAGPDQLVDLSTVVTLDASGSSDLDGDTLTYAWQQIGGGFVTLSSPTAESPTFTSPGSSDVLEFLLIVSDGTTFDVDFVTVHVTTPISPTTDTDAAANSVAENAIVGTTVGVTAFASDPDPGDTVSYSLDDNAGGLFSINSATGVVTVAGNLDFETSNSHNITVRATSTDSSSTTAVFTIAVTDVNDAPVITSSGIVSVDENQTAVTTVTASDQDLPANTLTYAITGGADGSQFSINATTGALTFNTAPNFEAPADAGANNLYEVQVTVSDGNGGTDTQLILVTVDDVNESPTITSPGSTSVDENQTAVMTVTASDPDLPANTLTYSISGGADQARFSINATTGALTFNTAPDFEAPTDVGADNTYEVQVTVDDGNGGTDIQTITVNVNDVNDSPTITSAGTVNVDENQTAVMTVTASDQDLPANTLSYSISGGADSAHFSINASTGELTFNAAPDFETPTDVGANNSYEVQVTVDDGNGGTDTQTITVNVDDVNDAPTITSTNTVGVDENQTAVMTVTASDQDLPANTLTYSISGGADQARFSINATTGALTFNTAPDFEAPTDVGADNTYEVQVTVDDGNGGTDIQTITVNVNDVNDSPTITSAGTVNVDENQTAVMTVTASDQDLPANTLSYSISGGTDSAHFSINASTGELTFNAAPDFETPTDVGANNSYEVQVTVDDGNGGTDTQTITVNVDDVNDAPTITSTNTVGVDENQTAVMTVTASDQDLPANTLTYSISGGADQARFSINATTGALTFNTAPDFEAPTDVGADNTYEVQVTVDDGNGGSDIQTITVNVNDVNDSPTITSAGTVNVDENQTAVMTVTASDQDLPANTLSYSISGGADSAHFSINASTGELTFNAAPDFETPTDVGANNSYEVQVTVDDGNGGTDTQTITVNVDDVNDAPVITSAGSVNVDENQTTVMTVTASDADLPANTLTYSISGGADQARFSINATTGALTFNTAPDFEAPTDVGADNTYEVQVTVDDGNGGTDIQLITVNVNDVNDSPTITSAGTVNVDENQTAVMTVTASDQDLPANTLSYSISGGADSAHFSINASTGELTFNAAPDFETPTDVGANNSYEVQVTVDDGNGGTDTQTITVNVGDVNDAPTITSTNTVGVDENQTAVMTVTASDQDLPANTLTFSLTGGADQAHFSINASTGELTFNVAPDFEAPTDVGANNSYEVEVTVDDGNGGTDIQLITVNVNDANDAPTITSSNTAVVSENQTTVMTVTASDIDLPANTLTFSLTGGADQARFSINATTGELTFNVAPDFEAPTDVGADNSYEVEVTVDDGNGGTDIQTITVNVTDVNDAPTITSTNTVGVNENQTAVMTVTASDQDLPANTLTFSLTGGADQAHFSINASTGELTFNVAPDFESPTDVGANNSYEVEVTVDDGNGGTDIQLITVNVNDANDAPTITSSNTAVVSENQTTVLTVTANDVDLPADTLTYSISGGADAARFTVDALTGELTFVTAPDFETPTDVGADNSYEVIVQVNDGNGGTDTQLITVNVVDANDAPVITSSGTVNADENQTAVTTVSASDPDLPANTLTYSISGGADQAHFSINSATGELVFNTAPDFEAPTDVGLDNTYEVEVTVDDGNGGTDVQLISVNVVSVNEAPIDITLDNASIQENATAAVIGNLTVVDPDAGDTHSWTVDDTRFEVVGSQLRLKAGESLNHETEPTVRVNITAIDQGGTGFSYSESFDLTVVDVNEAPTDITITDNRIDERTRGAVVGRLSVDDVDAGDSHTWSVNDSRFQIVGSNLKLRGGEQLNASQEPTIALTITATDQAGTGLSFSKTITIIVEEVALVAPPETEPDPTAEETQLEEELQEELDEELEQETEEASESEEGVDLEPESAAALESEEQSASQTEPLDESEAASEQTVKTDLALAAQANPGISQYAIANFGGFGPGPFAGEGSESPEFRTEDSLLDAFLQDSLANKLSRIDFAMMSQSGEMWDSLDEQRRVVDSVVKADLMVIGSAGVAASSATVGVVAWGMRSGFLFSGLLAQMPAWQAVDPMIVMQGFNGGGGAAKETVEQLMERRGKEIGGNRH